MKVEEKILIGLLRTLSLNGAAVALEIHIAVYGPLTDEAGEIVREILAEKNMEV